ncbi:MAG: hypothetical protein GY898_12890, partial [Proteobacteria bacterium]|nr:hypothetical protein [Pseudomonadota bacterium]
MTRFPTLLGLLLVSLFVLGCPDDDDDSAGADDEALLHGSERGRIGPLSGSLGVSASDSVRFRHPELGHAIEDVHTDHR